jgi:hypothetical protein
LASIGIDRLPMPADEQPHVLALQAARKHTVVLLDAHIHIEAEAVGDLLEQLF